MERKNKEKRKERIIKPGKARIPKIFPKFVKINSGHPPESAQRQTKTMNESEDEKIWEKLYGALWKLMQYEDAESDPEKVAELMERDTAKAAEHAPTGYGMICPVCGDLVQIWQKYCGGCEQRLKKWED